MCVVNCSGRLAAVVLGALTTLLFVAACKDSRTSPAATSDKITTANAFVGNNECRECHPAIFEEHKGSRHDITLRTMDRESLGEQAPPTGKIPNSAYALEDHPLGGYAFGLEDGPKHKLELVFGSGKSGMAFASIPGEGMFAEARMSYYPPTKRWFVTPGQQGMTDRSIGNMMQGKAGRQCLECHTVTLSPATLKPETRFFGVGCEACHGPGANHIKAAREGKVEDLKMTNLAQIGGRATNELCGKCHRTEKDVVAKDLGEKHTDLFQAHGLAQSACFRKSNDKLTCMSCHKPHQNVNHNETEYVKTCLSCHAPSAAASRTSVPARVCPVNPMERCVTCHMPKVPEPLFKGQPRSIADHFIRIHHKLRKL